MILSVSRRCDIPAFFGKWFLNRLKEDFVCVRNPYNRHSVSKIMLDPQTVDCIVFWTKNAAPFLQFLPQIDELGYRYYFQFTVTQYGLEIERNVGDKEKIIQTFRSLSKRIGKERVIWRYDPILLTDGITADWHIEKFREMCGEMQGYTERVVISFLDEYQKLDKVKYRAPDEAEMLEIGGTLAEIAKEYGLHIQTCAEKISIPGIEKGACIDKTLIERICGTISVKKDKSQRMECLCAESIDIGEYDTCAHFCEYCYANHRKATIERKMAAHDDASPLLIGNLEPTDSIHPRKTYSLRRLCLNIGLRYNKGETVSQRKRLRRSFA